MRNRANTGLNHRTQGLEVECIEAVGQGSAGYEIMTALHLHSRSGVYLFH